MERNTREIEYPVPNAASRQAIPDLRRPYGSSFTTRKGVSVHRRRPRKPGGVKAQTDSYQPDGSTAEILAGTLQCLLIGTRIVDTVHGPGMVADIALTEPEGLVGVEASFFCSSMLSRLINQVTVGSASDGDYPLA